MPTGATWSYSGVKDGAAYSEAESYSRTTFNGHAVICDATTDITPDGTSYDESYLSLDADGLRMYGGQDWDMDGTVTTVTYGQPVLVLTTTISDGQVLRCPTIPLTMSIRNPDGSTYVLGGTENVTVTVNGLVPVNSPSGMGFSQALKLTREEAISVTGPINGRAVTINDHFVDIGWQVKDLGCVRTQTSDAFTYSNGAQPENHTDSTTLTAASLLSNFAISPAKVPEHQPAGAVVGTFAPASPNLGGSLTYRLVKAAAYPDNASFTILGNQLLTAGEFNYEGKSSYSICVRARDVDGNTFDKNVVVKVKNINETPTSVALSPSKIAENMPAGTVVGSFSTTDPDIGNTFTYTLADGGADNASFRMASNGRLKTNLPLDFETQRSYGILVRSQDQGGFFCDTPITIRVTDVNEAPTGVALTNYSVPQHLPPGALVGKLIGTDPDALSTLTYTLVGGIGSRDNAMFTILNGKLRTAAVFDYAVKSLYKVRVRVTDQRGLSYETAIRIDVTQ